MTTIPWSFSEAVLYTQPIKPLSHLLEVSGANGQPVPYKDYIDVSITFQKEFVGTEIEVMTLTMVVPDLRADGKSQILIGTNILDALHENTPT